MQGAAVGTGRRRLGTGSGEYTRSRRGLATGAHSLCPLLGELPAHGGGPPVCPGMNLEGRRGMGQETARGRQWWTCPSGLLAVLRGLHLEVCPTWREPTCRREPEALPATAGVAPSLCQTDPGGEGGS